MSTRIQINEPRMNSFFDRVMDEIFLIFHYHPLSFPTEALTADELSEMNYYQSMGRSFYQHRNESYLADDGLQVQREERGSQVRFRRENNPKFAHLYRSSK